VTVMTGCDAGDCSGFDEYGTFPCPRGASVPRTHDASPEENSRESVKRFGVLKAEREHQVCN